MNELSQVTLCGGMAVLALVMGLRWMRNARTWFMAWPAFCLVGVLMSIALQNETLGQLSVWLGMAAVALQIVIDARAKRR
ncbi:MULTISPECIES: hypothetical protein [unclassified Variovorax]|uniref:hypothetical protein n=1 Tax=unclassified Variovorax TaxID=663243 RepID=UPI0034E88D3D